MKKQIIVIAIFVAFLIPISLFAFDDVGQNHHQKNSIDYVENYGYMKGYDNGEFKPKKDINRAEVAKVLILKVFPDFIEENHKKACFTDIDPIKWYTPYICSAKEISMVNGYADGTFKPSGKVKIIEALKMVMEAYNFEYETNTEPWYQGIVSAASERNLIPLDITSFHDTATRAQFADLLARADTYNWGTQEDLLKEYKSFRVTYNTIENNENILAKAKKEIRENKKLGTYEVEFNPTESKEVNLSFGPDSQSFYLGAHQAFDFSKYQQVEVNSRKFIVEPGKAYVFTIGNGSKGEGCELIDLTSPENESAKIEQNNFNKELSECVIVEMENGLQLVFSPTSDNDKKPTRLILALKEKTNLLGLENILNAQFEPLDSGFTENSYFMTANLKDKNKFYQALKDQQLCNESGMDECISSVFEENTGEVYYDDEYSPLPKVDLIKQDGSYDIGLFRQKFLCFAKGHPVYSKDKEKCLDHRQSSNDVPVKKLNNELAENYQALLKIILNINDNNEVQAGIEIEKAKKLIADSEDEFIGSAYLALLFSKETIIEFYLSADKLETVYKTNHFAFLEAKLKEGYLKVPMVNLEGTWKLSQFFLNKLTDDEEVSTSIEIEKLQNSELIKELETLEKKNGGIDEAVYKKWQMGQE